MGRLSICIVLALLLAIIAPRPGHPHDWYDKYTTKNGIPCCGGKDCDRLPKEAVRPVATGYAVKIGEEEYVIPYSDVQESQDDDFHICIWGDGPKCFFAPPLGA